MANKEIVIWGAGALGSRYAKFIGINEVSFFIDSSQEKTKKLFLGKKVVYPDEITEWDNLIIYIPENYRLEISKTLIDKGLKENLDFFVYSKKKVKVNIEEIKRECRIFLEKIKKNREQISKKIVVISNCVAEGDGYCNFLNNLGKRFDLVGFSDAVWISEDETREKLNFPSFVLPDFLELNCAVEVDEHIVATTEIKEYLQSRKYLIEAAENINLRLKRGDEYGEVASYYADVFFRQVFSIINPVKLIVHSTFLPFHRIASLICEEINASTIHIHQGCLYGTFTLEENGEMGRSDPAVFSKKFKSLPIDNLDKAKKIWNYLFSSAANRKVQSKTNIIKIIEPKIDKERPIIFFAGQNDFSSGMIPYNEISQNYHSPIFKTSTEAALFLQKICERNKWNFVYKPHPSIDENRKMFSEKTIFMDHANINQLIDLCDVTVTILSSTAYVALTRYKPTVMLGYTQLLNKDCTYEAFEKDIIEETIGEAISAGFTTKQQDAFLKHIAQLEKYYLYDDLTERPIRYGKTIPENWEEIEKLGKMLCKS